jgi:hypothetical protein
VNDPGGGGEGIWRFWLRGCLLGSGGSGGGRDNDWDFGREKEYGCVSAPGSRLPCAMIGSGSATSPSEAGSIERWFVSCCAAPARLGGTRLVRGERGQVV